MSNGYLLLALAIVAEVIATSSLKAAENFTRFWPSVLVVIGYVAAFWLLHAGHEDRAGGRGLCHLVRGGDRAGDADRVGSIPAGARPGGPGSASC